MAWETRKRGSRYYTRSRRVEGRVEREYVGKGEVAELIAMRDEQLRESRKIQKIGEEIALRAKMGPVERIGKDIENLHQILNTDLERRLNAIGYHYHRGSWRKRRTP